MKGIILILSVLLISQDILGQESLTLTLEDCLDRALTSSKQLNLKSLEREKQRFAIEAERRYFIPEIQAYAKYFQYLDDKPVFVFPQNINENLSGPVELGAPLNFYTGVTINQHILDARMFNGKSLKGRFSEVNRLQQEIDEDEIRYEVIKTFYQIQIIEQSRGLITFNSERLVRLEQVTESAVQNGMASSTALEELQLRQKELELSDKELINNLDQLKAYLSLLCGIPPDTPVQLVYTDPKEDLAFVGSDTVSNKTYELLELQKTINSESIAQQASASYPTLDFFAAVQWLQQEGYGDLFSSDGTWFNQHIIGLKLNVPILNPESRKVKSQEMRINQDIISMQQELLIERTRMERQKALNGLELSREELELADEKQKLYGKQFEQAQVRYEQQYSSLQDLLSAEEKFRSARFSFQQQKIAYFLAILEVYESFDQLDEFNE